MFTHFSPKTTIFCLLRGHFWPKTWKIKCFQFIQSKISQFVTQMWLPKKLQFLVPGTPPDPPIPPLTPPGVRGSQKWPKCIPSSPIMIMNAKKAISGGGKNFDLFFHSECTNYSCHHINSVSLMTVSGCFILPKNGSEAVCHSISFILSSE